MCVCVCVREGVVCACVGCTVGGKYALYYEYVLTCMLQTEVCLLKH